MRIFGYLYKFEEFGSIDVRILSKSSTYIREILQDAGRVKDACKQKRKSERHANKRMNKYAKNAR